jgi:hypothetical protein
MSEENLSKTPLLPLLSVSLTDRHVAFVLCGKKAPDSIRFNG